MRWWWWVCGEFFGWLALVALVVALAAGCEVDGNSPEQVPAAEQHGANCVGRWWCDRDNLCQCSGWAQPADAGAGEGGAR